MGCEFETRSASSASAPYFFPAIGIDSHQDVKLNFGATPFLFEPSVVFGRSSGGGDPLARLVRERPRGGNACLLPPEEGDDEEGFGEEDSDDASDACSSDGDEEDPL